MRWPGERRSGRGLPSARPADPAVPGPGPRADTTEGGSPVPGGSRIRPFLVTAGRTTGATAIALEAQVMITPRGQTAVDTLSFEYRDIVCLCEQPLAVAEIAARLSLHLGAVSYTHLTLPTKRIV